MANPFEYDDDGPSISSDTQVSSADERAIQGMREAIDRDDEPVRSEPVRLDDNGNLDISTDPEGERETRQDKKRSRYKEAQEGRQAAEDQLRRVEAELAAERVASRQRQAPQGPPQRDIGEERINENMRQRESVADQFNGLQEAGKLTPEKRRELIDQQKGLERRGQELVWEQMDRRKEANRDPQKDTMDQLTGRHPDVMSDPKAFQWAEGRARMRRAEGEEFNHDLVDSVMEETRKHFSMGKYKGGVPNEEAYATRGGGGNGKGNVSKTVKMTPQMRRQADYAFSHISDPGKRYKAWAQTAGKAFLEREAREGR